MSVYITIVIEPTAKRGKPPRPEMPERIRLDTVTVDGCCPTVEVGDAVRRLVDNFAFDLEDMDVRPGRGCTCDGENRCPAHAFKKAVKDARAMYRRGGYPLPSKPTRCRVCKRKGRR